MAAKKLISFPSAMGNANEKEKEKAPTPGQLMAVNGLEESFQACVSDLKAADLFCAMT